MGVGGQRHDSVDLLLGKTRYSLYWRLGGPQGRSGYVGGKINMLPLPELQPRGEGSASSSERSSPREGPGTLCIGGCVDLRVGLDRCRVSRPHRDSVPKISCPSRSWSIGVRGQHHAPAALHPGKDLVPTVEVAGWALGPVWTGAEYLAPSGTRSPDRPATNSHYTD